MSTGVGSEAGMLPVTGSGPFTMLLALIGVALAATGGLFRRMARR